MIFLKWFAALFLDKLIQVIGEKLNWLIDKFKREKVIKEETKEDGAHADTYNQTLKDKVTEQAQINASLDVLNGTDRTEHKP